MDEARGLRPSQPVGAWPPLPAYIAASTAAAALSEAAGSWAARSPWRLRGAASLLALARPAAPHLQRLGAPRGLLPTLGLHGASSAPAPAAAAAAPPRGYRGRGLGLLAAGRAAATAPGGCHHAPLPSPCRPPAARLLSTQQAPAAGAAATAAAAPPSAPQALLQRLLRGRLGTAVRLQLGAAWQKHSTLVMSAGGLTAVYLLWRLMHSVTNSYIALTGSVAEVGLASLAASTVLLAGLYLRWHVAVSPAAVYRQALVRLNTHPGVLEVMGAPLVGSEVRAYVVTGGGVYLSKSFRLKFRSRRIQMMFPLSGPERKGLVSLEAKRKNGAYAWRLLAVDLGPELQGALPQGAAHALPAGPQRPAQLLPAPPHQRVYVLGDEAAYQRGGVLAELRSPFLQALSNSRSYEVEDELEDELDELAVPQRGAGGLGAAVGAVGAAVQRARRSAVAAAEGLVGGRRDAEAGAHPAADPAIQEQAAQPAGAAAGGAGAGAGAAAMPAQPAAGGKTAASGGAGATGAAPAAPASSGGWFGRLLRGPGEPPAQAGAKSA